MPQSWSSLNDELARVRERGLERLEWAKSGYKAPVLTPELDRLADEYGGEARSRRRNVKIEALLRAAARRIDDRKHRLRVEIVLGLTHAGASATELRRIERRTFREESLDAGALRARERESFTALETAIYQVLAEPEERGEKRLSALSEYLTKVRGQLTAARGQIFVLPTPDTVFVNRTVEMETLDAATSSANGSVSFLVGMPGAGKSAAAIQFAVRYRYRFADAVLYVDLGRTDTVQGVLTEISFQLGVPDVLTSVSTDVEREALIRAILANQRVLIILDDGSQSSPVQECLRALLGADVIVTTRDRLLAEMRAPVDVEPLERGDALDLLADVIGSARISRDEQSALRLLEMLGDLPLAIRVYGARIALSRARLSSHVARLTTFSIANELVLPGMAQVTKAASVPASFALSFQALSVSQLAMMSGLGVLEGAEFTPACAGAIAGVSAVQGDRITSELYGCSLLLHGVEGRWRLHPLIDDFARAMHPFGPIHRDRLIKYAIGLADHARANARSTREAASFARRELDKAAVDRAALEARRRGDLDSEAWILAGVARVAAG